MISLIEVKNKYPRTDKGNDHQGLGGGYLPHYETHLGPRRREVKTVLEIGVREGDSLRMWRDYFPNARIIGIDFNPNCAFAEERIEVHVGNVCDPRIQQSVIQSAGQPFDLVIDDGSHYTTDMITAFESFFPKVKPDGYYVVEDLDWQVKDGPYNKIAETVNHHEDMLSYLYRLGRQMHLTPLSQDIAGLNFYQYLAFVRRRSV